MLTRFRKALFGWISYMPLFLRLTHASTVEKFLLDLRARRALLEPLAEALGTHLNDAHYKKLVACFDTYCASVENDRVDWLQANHYWRRLILPAARQSLLQGTELQTQRSISLSKVRERASDE
jgi:DNA-binding GntR family transcriptional regulator